MATGGDVVLQMLRELRDLQQQVQVENGRTEERLTRTQANVATLTQNVATLTRNVETLTQNVETLRQNVVTMAENMGMLTQNMSGLVESFRGTKERHEQYLAQLGRTVDMLADQQRQDRDRLDTHEHRIGALEQV